MKLIELFKLTENESIQKVLKYIYFIPEYKTELSKLESDSSINKVYETIIPRSVKLSEAPSFGLPICKYEPKSNGALAYKALADEILAKEEGN